MRYLSGFAVLCWLTLGQGALQASAQVPLPSPPEPKASAPAAKAPPAKTDRKAAVPANSAELEFWSAVKDSKNPDELKAYLETYPTGSFAALAKVRLKALGTGDSASAASAQTAPAGKVLPVETMKEVQVRLHALNYPITVFDGLLTAELVEAVRRWQTNNKFQPTGTLTDAELVFLRGQKPPTVWGAVAFTAKDTFVTFKKPSRMEAETEVLDRCRTANGKDCKAAAVPLNHFAAAAGFRERVSNGQTQGTATGMSISRAVNLSVAQIQALALCARNPTSQGRCEIVEKVCGDGSHINTTPVAPKSTPKKDARDT
jgi:peptidoglycan hydrolase-like protein with peptidoglycan-binding domain